MSNLTEMSEPNEIEKINGKLEAIAKAVNGNSKSKKPILSGDYITKLNELGYYFSLLTLSDTLLINGQAASDALEAKIRAQMRDAGFKNVAEMRDAYIANAYDNPVNPIEDYIDRLKWDGEQRIDRLVNHFTDSHTGTGRRPGDTAPRLRLWLKKWMVGAIAKVYTGYQNPMLVLASKTIWTPDGKRSAQGTGKSTFAKWLCSGIPDYFIPSAINPLDKDYKIRTLNHFIWEVDELGSTTRKSDVEALKSFITMPVVTTRPSYARNDIRKRPIANFIGTVNLDGTGFLRDTTGNRRFLTVEIQNIDFGYVSLDVNQIWAEAKEMYEQGYSPELTAAEAQMRDEENAEYGHSSTIEDVIIRHFEITHKMDDTVSTLDIIAKCNFEDVKDTSRGMEMEISRYLTSEGLIKKLRPSRWYGIKSR